MTNLTPSLRTVSEAADAPSSLTLRAWPPCMAWRRCLSQIACPTVCSDRLCACLQASLHPTGSCYACYASDVHPTMSRSLPSVPDASIGCCLAGCFIPCYRVIDSTRELRYLGRPCQSLPGRGLLLGLGAGGQVGSLRLVGWTLLRLFNVHSAATPPRYRYAPPWEYPRPSQKHPSNLDPLLGSPTISLNLHLARGCLMEPV